MKNNYIILVTLALLVVGSPLVVNAELSSSEKEVIYFMNYLQEMALTGEYTEGISKKDIESFVAENVETMAKMYKIRPYDVLALVKHALNGVPLPSDYTAPSMPTIQERESWEKKLKSSLVFYSSKSK